MSNISFYQTVGDIVLCPGKWANEDMVALVEAAILKSPLCGDFI